MIFQLIIFILSGASSLSTELPSEPMLCSLAESLLTWSPPMSGEGCTVPFAMGCGRRSLFADDGKPVVRLVLDGEEKAKWAYPAAPCAERGIWLYRSEGEMPPGATAYLQVFLDRVKRREVSFVVNIGSPPHSSAGCGEYSGIARFNGGKWKLYTKAVSPPARGLPNNQKCEFSKEEVFHCNEGGPTSR